MEWSLGDVSLAPTIGKATLAQGVSLHGLKGWGRCFDDGKQVASNNFTVSDNRQRFLTREHCLSLNKTRAPMRAGLKGCTSRCKLKHEKVLNNAHALLCFGIAGCFEISIRSDSTSHIHVNVDS